MSESAHLFDQLLRRRMATAKAAALYAEAELALMQSMAIESAVNVGPVLAGIHRGKAKALMAAADHIVRTELVDV